MVVANKALEISSISDMEYVKIVSSFLTMAEPRFKCNICKKKYIREPKKQELLFKQNACKDEMPMPVLKYTPTHTMSGYTPILYNRCPANFSDFGYMEIINLYSHYAKGIMPYDGGLLNQPAKFVEVMELVHNLIEEKQFEQQEKLKKYRR